MRNTLAFCSQRVRHMWPMRGICAHPGKGGNSSPHITMARPWNRRNGMHRVRPTTTPEKSPFFSLLSFFSNFRSPRDAVYLFSRSLTFCFFVIVFYHNEIIFFKILYVKANRNRKRWSLSLDRNRLKMKILLSFRETAAFPQTCTPFSSNSVWKFIMFNRAELCRGRARIVIM